MCVRILLNVFILIGTMACSEINRTVNSDSARDEYSAEVHKITLKL